jgi:hypothetical protein
MRWAVSGYRRKLYRSCTATTIDTRVIGEMQKIRTGRHCAFVMHVHVAFVTTFRHKVFTDTHLTHVTPPPAEAGGFSLRRVGVATDQPGP